MTSRSAAERGPRTVAGRALLDSMRGKYRPGTLGWLGADTWIPTILAIEAEATAAMPLDHGDHVPAWKWCYFGLTIGKAEAQGVPGHRFCEGCARLSADEESGTT